MKCQYLPKANQHIYNFMHEIQSLLCSLRFCQYKKCINAVYHSYTIVRHQKSSSLSLYAVPSEEHGNLTQFRASFLHGKDAITYFFVFHHLQSLEKFQKWTKHLAKVKVLHKQWQLKEIQGMLVWDNNSLPNGTTQFYDEALTLHFAYHY